MPPHIIMQGIPACIIDIIISQRPFIISIWAGSIGIILQTIPSLPISQVILHIIGIMPMPIIGIIIGMPMPMCIMGFMPIPIIMGFIIIGFIPMWPMWPIIGFIGIWWFIIGIGIAFIMVAASYGHAGSAQARAA